jgi:AcrR family transcriptional regulator
MSLDPAQDHLRGQEDQEQPVDGRTARGQRTRSSVVDALLALQEEGDLSPTAQQVAARAGVALRTVFGHFSDMETLWAEAGQRELAKLSSWPRSSTRASRSRSASSASAPRAPGSSRRSCRSCARPGCGAQLPGAAEEPRALQGPGGS